MCGRFVIARESDELSEIFDIESVEISHSIRSYNIAPTQSVPIIVEREIDGVPSRQLHSARWGLVPSFAKDLAGPPLFNARIETALEKPSFKDAALLKRCVVPASGYFEWSKENKTPFYIHPPDGMLGFAGIYWWWRDPSKPQTDPTRWLLTCSILTKDSAPEISEIHDRNPVMLTPDALAAWMAPDFETSPELLVALARESDSLASELEYFEVSKSVGSVSNNSPELILPI
ncbi:MAG TPA: SOS response-associated peptidase [Aquiluna sp.]